MNPATVWAEHFIDELSRAGVEHVCICPGSRSTPLVLAVASHPAFRKYVHLDERSAAFFALGIGKITGRPAAVITTSGTAVANLFPAVVEAAQSETPLLLVTADRPAILRGTDANQTIDQVELFGDYVNHFAELDLPVDRPEALVRLRRRVRAGVTAALGCPQGPVHLNVPFEKPLEPELPPSGSVRPQGEASVEEMAQFREAALGRAAIPMVPAAPTSGELDALAAVVRDAKRGVIVVGPNANPKEFGAAALALAAGTGFPVLADPLSGARFGPKGNASVLGAYDLFLRSEDVRRRLEPDLVVRFGRSPTSAATCTWLAEHFVCPQWIIDPGGQWRDHLGAADDYLTADVRRSVAGVLHRVAADRSEDPAADLEWAGLWTRAEASARSASASFQGEGLFEDTVLSTVVRTLPAAVPFMVSSSMPVRDLDAFGEPREESLTVVGNRGASGIDGILSTGLGISAGAGGPAVVVVGDVAFFHDVGGLLATRETGVEVVFVVIQNDGGGIFHMLPIREHEPHFTTYFATPHGLDVSRAAALYDVEHHHVGSREDLERELSLALEQGGSRVLEVRTDRRENQIRHEAIVAAVAAAVRTTLEGEEN